MKRDKRPLCFANKKPQVFLSYLLIVTVMVMAMRHSLFINANKILVLPIRSFFVKLNTHYLDFAELNSHKVNHLHN